MTGTLGRPGLALTAVDTPALVLDLDAFEENLVLMQRLTATAGIALRPHGKAHRCSAIAKAQIAGGAVGICCQTVGEAEQFVDAGIEDVFVSNVIVDPAKILRLARLALRAKVSVCVDDERIVPLLEAATGDAGATLEVLVEVDLGDHRLGRADVPGALRLATAISATRHLRFGGLQTYLGSAQHEGDPDQRRKLAGEAAATALRFRDALAAAGLDCGRITGGGTGTVADDCDFGAFTEVQPGTYPFLDANYSRNRAGEGAPRFRQALFVLTQVVSVAAAGHVTCNAGLKSFSMESGFPEVYPASHMHAVRVSDEHTKLECGDLKPDLGERILLVPGHCDPTFNLHNSIIGFRGAEVETVWAIDARGASA